MEVARPPVDKLEVTCYGNIEFPSFKSGWWAGGYLTYCGRDRDVIDVLYYVAAQDVNNCGIAAPSSVTLNRYLGYVPSTLDDP